MAVDLLPLTNDYVFANLFGRKSHERVLVCLLNSILNGKPHIKSITLDRTEYKKEMPDGKSIRLDIAATSDDGTLLNIELQCKNQGNILDRASFYSSRLRENALKEGENYSNIPNIISIWICEEAATNRKSSCNEIVEMFKANGIDPVEIASEKMRKFIIELSKLEFTPKSFVNDMFTVWMRFIKDPKSIPEEFLRIEEVKEAMDTLTKMSADPETRKEYEQRQKELNDFYAGQSVKYEEGLKEGEKKGLEKGLKEGEKKGLEKGLKEGEKKGREDERARAHQEKIASAKKMLTKGIDVADISDFTGLSLEEIRNLSRE